MPSSTWCSVWFISLLAAFGDSCATSIYRNYCMSLFLLLAFSPSSVFKYDFAVKRDNKFHFPFAIVSPLIALSN